MEHGIKAWATHTLHRLGDCWFAISVLLGIPFLCDSSIDNMSENTGEHGGKKYETELEKKPKEYVTRYVSVFKVYIDLLCFIWNR